MKTATSKLKTLFAQSRRPRAESLVLQKYLELLAEYDNLLSDAESGSQRTSGSRQYNHLHFDKQVTLVLKDLCSPSHHFWCDSACVWLLENHQDRGELFLPGPGFKLSKSIEFKGAIPLEEVSKDVESGSSVSINRVVKNVDRAEIDLTSGFPIVFVPMHKKNRKVGVLAVYGKLSGAVPTSKDILFLTSLASLITNAMEQWEWRFKSLALVEMDDLFLCRSLSELWPRAAKIMKEYLAAAGCMIVFRPDPNDGLMHIMAAEGFSDRIYGSEYHTFRGQTGKCAATGQSIRWDDVLSHKDQFDSPMLKALEKAHRKPIRSWMAIPIGPRDRNYGVIKVINRVSRCEWFIDEDELLGNSLALRLKVIIEKFAHIAKIEKATEEGSRQRADAERNAQLAIAARQRAEAGAVQRQGDLMLITHQLQGPLNSVIGALSGLQQAATPRNIAEEIEFAKALAESCLILCWGTSATFAKGAGQTISFSPDEIDAPSGLRRLCRMLQLTNTGNYLTFKHKEDPVFPKLRMDPAVFTSVVFSLIHNAMKYADENSTVILECSFERSGEAALKIKSIGEPIHPSERESIFEMFKRGRNVERSGRHHSGVGLGLWVSRQLMRAIGGDLTVELSTEHPRLSVFVVHIPDSSGIHK